MVAYQNYLGHPDTTLVTGRPAIAVIADTYNIAYTYRPLSGIAVDSLSIHLYGLQFQTEVQFCFLAHRCVL